MSQGPDITIGMPVRNGGQQIRTALDKSTDDTVAVCQEYAARDSRVTVVAQPANLGICGNFRFVLMEARTPFFMWACHDDVWNPTFAEKNYANLMANPGAVASGSQVSMLGLDGVAQLSAGTAPLRGSVTKRLTEFFHSPSDASRFYSLFRTRELQRSFPEDIDVFGYDWVVLALTLLKGEHLEVEEVLLEREDHPVNHYHKSLVRQQSRALYRFLPHLPMALTLKRVLPPEHWNSVKPLIMRRNMIESLMYARYRFPVLNPALQRLASAEKILRRSRHLHSAGVGPAGKTPHISK
jgi:glycosyltransferase involved in cell wall biosynthesis